jgi:hypothetical protein
MSEVNTRTGIWGTGIWGSEAMAAAIAIAGGTSAYAGPVAFENDGGFRWHPAVCGEQNWLDITLDSNSQPNVYGDSAFSQWYYYGLCNDERKSGNYMYASYGFTDAAWVQENGDYGRVDRLEGGYVIGAGAAFGDRSTMSLYESDCCYSNDWGPPGTEGYIGVRFGTPGNIHYGWIKARMTDPRGAALEALAWGYESSPNTPIAAGDGLDVRCYADFDGNGVLELFDFLGFVNAFNALDPNADCDENGTFDLFDFLCFTNSFNAGC